MTNVLFFSPGYPSEMPFFVRGLARVGAKVLGLGDQPAAALPPMAKERLAAHLHVARLWDEEAVVEEVLRWAPTVGGIDRVECLWEPGILVAARLREALGAPGMRVTQATKFRDKEEMKQALDAAGLRTPRHRRCATAAAVREAAATIGYPLIVKPIAGAGSADTHRVDDAAALERALPLLLHVPEVSVEEFVEGDEFTFDAISSNGAILFRNVSWYRPRPLIQRTVEWISPQTIALRDLDAPELAGGIALGEAVLQALGHRDGFTHMEWFRTPKGEAVFGEIGARPPGAHSVDIMNYACDFDAFTAWAEATTLGRLSAPVARAYNAAIVFKRAQGRGRIRRIDGLEGLVASLGDHLVSVDLLPVGAPRRDWLQTLLSDGWLIVRHPDLQETLHLADRVGTDLQMYAG